VELCRADGVQQRRGAEAFGDGAAFGNENVFTRRRRVSNPICVENQTQLVLGQRRVQGLFRQQLIEHDGFAKGRSVGCSRARVQPGGGGSGSSGAVRRCARHIARRAVVGSALVV